jgi:hypothetical protein
MSEVAVTFEAKESASAGPPKTVSRKAGSASALTAASSEKGVFDEDQIFATETASPNFNKNLEPAKGSPHQQ